MRIHKAIGLVLVALILVGCTVEPETVHAITASTPRADVEEVLGEPVTSETTSIGLIHTYSYFTAADVPTVSGGGPASELQVYLYPVAQTLWGAGVFDHEHQLHITYRPDDRVMDFVSAVSYGQTPENEILLKRKLEKLSGFGTQARAEGGDPVAQFRIYKQEKAPSEESLRWLCLSAHWGHPPAQEELGILHLPGLDDNSETARLVLPNDVTAYVWYSIADLNGLKRALFLRDDLSKDMTDKRIAEAERLVAQWKPNPAECDTTTAEAEN